MFEKYGAADLAQFPKLGWSGEVEFYLRITGVSLAAIVAMTISPITGSDSISIIGWQLAEHASITVVRSSGFKLRRFFAWANPSDSLRQQPT